MISAREADWTRESIDRFWAPSKKLLLSIRDYQRLTQENSIWSKVLKGLAIYRHRFWTVITGADIPLNCQIEGGLILPHPNGIVIHHSANIGPNCLIHQQVTIGVKHNQMQGPKIAGHVDIGAGAKIIGNITIGSHVLIGANAVVTKDVPAYSIVAGVPAKIIGTTAEQKKEFLD